jgi:hypothetical protein
MIPPPKMMPKTKNTESGSAGGLYRELKKLILVLDWRMDCMGWVLEENIF